MEDALLEKTLSDLEWHKLEQHVATLLRGPSDPSFRLTLAGSFAETQASLAETAEALALLREGEPLPLDGIRDIAPHLLRVERHGDLDVVAVNDVRLTLGVDPLGGAGASYGEPTNAAYGLDSQTPVVAYFDVIGRNQGTVAPAAYADPPEGGPGTVFTFYASGFKKDERVSWWVTAPDNTVVDARPAGEKANSKGEIRFRWHAPANAMAHIVTHN